MKMTQYRSIDSGCVRRAVTLQPGGSTALRLALGLGDSPPKDMLEHHCRSDGRLADGGWAIQTGLCPRL